MSADADDSQSSVSASADADAQSSIAQARKARQMYRNGIYATAEWIRAHRLLRSKLLDGVYASAFKRRHSKASIFKHK